MASRMTTPTEPRKEANPGTETPRMYLVIFQLFSVGIWCWWLAVKEMVASLFTAILHSEVNLTEVAVTQEHIFVCVMLLQLLKIIFLLSQLGILHAGTSFKSDKL